MDKGKEHALVAVAVAAVIPTAFGHPCVHQGDPVAVCAFDPGHPADNQERKPQSQLTGPAVAAVGTPGGDMPPGRPLLAQPQQDAYTYHPAYTMVRGNMIAPLLASSNSHVPPAPAPVRTHLCR